jgi:hypothetical protein
VVARGYPARLPGALPGLASSAGKETLPCMSLLPVLDGRSHQPRATIDVAAANPYFEASVGSGFDGAWPRGPTDVSGTDWKCRVEQ